MKNVISKIWSAYGSAGVNAYALIERKANTLMLMFGAFMLVVGLEQMASAGTSLSQAQYDDQLVRYAVGQLFCLVEGAFGALIMVVSGLGAIVAAAMGAYRAAVGMLVVAVGAFILRALVSLFFGTNFTEYGTGQEGCRGR